MRPGVHDRRAVPEGPSERVAMRFVWPAARKSKLRGLEANGCKAQCRDVCAVVWKE